MATDERLSGAIQENVLTLLCFDAKRANLVRAALGSPRLFESVIFREVAGHAFDFLEQFGEPIGEHLADQLEPILQGEDKRKAEVYKNLLVNLHHARGSVNGEYVLSQLQKFVRQQHIKAALVQAVEAVEGGNVDEAELAMHKGLSSQVYNFDAGTSLSDTDAALRFMDQIDDGISTGIDVLDRADCKPRKKEMFLIMAPPSRGKSWALMHLGKWAILQRQTVVHITLEMSEARCAQRYLQGFFSISKRQAEVKVPMFTKDENGQMSDVFYETLERTTLQDPDIRQRLSRRIKRELTRRAPLIIKEFATGSLTLTKLEAYLDGLERYHKIIPDYVVLDYPDLMEIDAKNQRTETGALLKGLRGLAVKRNFGLVAATQSNREGSRAKVLDEDNVAEDYSKIMIADTIVSYSQTAAEKALGLARLFAVKSRNDESKFATLITQAYAIGQFCLDSAYLPADYWSYLEDDRGTGGAAG